MDEISPLFALEAEQLLLSGFAEEAIEICNNGLAVYPDYPVARVILARAYNLIGKKEQSELILKEAKENSYGKVLDKFNINESILTIDNKQDSDEFTIEDKSYSMESISEILEVDKQQEKYQPQGNSFDSIDLDSFNDEFKELLNAIDNSIPLKIADKPKEIESVIIPAVAAIPPKTIINSTQVEKNKPEPKETIITKALSNILSKNEDFFFQSDDVNEKIESIENSIFYKINEEIERTKDVTSLIKIKENINHVNNDSLKMVVMGLISTRFINNKTDKLKPEEKSSDLPIYTETMAKIFTAQGAKDKAINIYRKLIISEPSKQEYYNTQIAKIT